MIVFEGWRVVYGRAGFEDIYCFFLYGKYDAYYVAPLEMIVLNKTGSNERLLNFDPTITSHHGKAAFLAFN